jgi:hypothetical protein
LWTFHLYVHIVIFQQHLLSQFIRYSRAFGFCHDFLDRVMLLARKVPNQGFLVIKLKSSLRKIYGRHDGLANSYGMCITNDHEYVLLVGQQLTEFAQNLSHWLCNRLTYLFTKHLMIYFLINTVVTSSVCNSRTASVTGELQSQVPVTWLSLHFWWKMTFNPSLKIRRFTINIYAWNQLKYTEDVYG